MNNLKNLCKIVSDNLGRGFSEYVYHESLCVLLRKRGVSYSKEVPIPVKFMGYTVGSVRADIILHDIELIVECKATEGVLKPSYISQLVNYMYLCNSRSGLLVNFNQHPCKEQLEFVEIYRENSEDLQNIKFRIVREGFTDDIYYDSLGNEMNEID